MHEMRETAVTILAPAQATDLSLLVESEAHWENLRKLPLRAQDQHPGAFTEDLRGIQKAYDDFHSKLMAYNKRHTPAHVPEQLLNTPRRLGKWCRAMRELCIQVEHDPRSHCPVHLLEKAYRWAERMSARMNKAAFNRPAPPATIRAAINDLGALVRWCDELAEVAIGA